MPRTLKDWLLCAICAGLITAGAYAALAVQPHLAAWLDNADQFAAQQRQSSVSQARSMANVEGITSDARAKLTQLDIAALNADLLAILRNTRAATGNAAAITAELNDKLPVAELGAAVLWQHADDAAAHFDTATADTRREQFAIAGETVRTLKQTGAAAAAIAKVAADPNIPLAVSHVAGAAGDVHAMTSDSKELVSYEKKKIETPLTKMQKLGGILQEYAARVAAYWLP